MNHHWVTEPIPGLEGLVADTVLSQSRHLAITDAARHRFWSRVYQTVSGCWIWTGAVGDDGYGRITWTRAGRTRTCSTHRFSLHLAHGPVLPVGLVAAHGCDHPLCVRVGVDHVHLSTQTANLNHAISVGRHDGPALVVDSTRRREHALRCRAQLTGSREAPVYRSGQCAREIPLF